MKKVYLVPLYRVIFMLALSLLGIFSDIAQLFDYNIYIELIKPNFPHSWIYLIMAHVFIYLVLVIFALNRSIENKLPENDLSILNEIGQVFSSNSFYNFKYYLEQSRLVYIDQIDNFEICAKRFLEKDKAMSKKSVERKKVKFLLSFLNFLAFSEDKFNPTANPNVAKFLSGKSGYDLKLSGTYEQIEQDFLQLTSDIYRSWDSFQKKLRKVYPDYVWIK